MTEELNADNTVNNADEQISTENSESIENHTENKTPVYADDEVYSSNMIYREENYDEKRCRWHILKSPTNSEARTVNEFIKKLKEKNIFNALVEIFTPKEKIIEVKNNKKVMKEKNFYPGCMFVKLEIYNKQTLDEISKFLLSKNHQLARVTDAEIEVARGLVAEFNEKPKTSINIAANDHVRVTDGPYKDMKGIVDKVDIENNKAFVKLSLFGRETPAELSLDQLENDV